MAGLNKNTPTPTEIKFHKQSKLLEITFNNNQKFQLSSEFLRVYSPSAEVQGHGPGQEVLQIDKQDVTIVKIEPIGQYAIQPHFSDGHNTGIYSKNAVEWHIAQWVRFSQW
ncbi:MAG TPA: gamma-butyrobetaine hydroxylase-like domain-containing protein, partial [Nitrosomonas sp.]|nr:gamma-butyrobetaine hydroxylase-like domain-containing protein [Nitrosomonas sp.]